nr:formate--tetrahydrofolate ligase [Natrarchaeobius chitinivorans]
MTFTDGARDDLYRIIRHGFEDLPVFLSKVPSSLSDDPDQQGVSTEWTLTVRELYPASGPEFVVALTGDVLTMPGLPNEPAAIRLAVDDHGNVTGL